MKKNEKTKKGNFFTSRRFKYGAVATVFTVVFIAAVILLNAIVSAIDSKFNLYLDLTENKIYTIDDQTVQTVRGELDEYREQLNGSDFKITITFLQPKDTLNSNQQTGWVVSLAESYAETFPEIVVEYKEDLLTHPELYTKYKLHEPNLSNESIIVSSSEAQTPPRIFSLDSCMVYRESTEELIGFKGEMQFNSAIKILTSQDHPVVAFTEGHLESKQEKLREIFMNCGFDVRDVDLYEEFIASQRAGGDDDDGSEAAIDEKIKLLVISNPQKDFSDFSDGNEKSEFDLLSDYLSDNRSIIVIASPEMPELPNLDELLRDWNVEIVRNEIILDDLSSVPGDRRMLYAAYPETDGIAADIIGSLTRETKPPRAVSVNTAPIRILQNAGEEDTSKSREAVLVSSDNAYVEVTGENGAVTKERGPFNLMVITTDREIKDNTNDYGHILVIGSENFTEVGTYDSEYANTDIIYNAIRLLTHETVPAPTNYKLLEEYGLEVDSGQVYTYGAVTVAVIPLVIFAFGLVVYLRRKHL